MERMKIGWCIYHQMQYRYGDGCPECRKSDTKYGFNTVSFPDGSEVAIAPGYEGCTAHKELVTFREDESCPLCDKLWCDEHDCSSDPYCEACLAEREGVSRAPDSNPKTSQGLSKLPLHLVPPAAIAHMALGFSDGGFKYQPYNWREERISASVYYGALMRHATAWWDGEDFSEDGVHHLAHVMCCCAMMLDAYEIDMIYDNRPPAGGAPKLLDRLKNRLPGLEARPSTKYGLHDIAGGGE